MGGIVALRDHDLAVSARRESGIRIVLEAYWEVVSSVGEAHAAKLIASQSKEMLPAYAPFSEAMAA